MQVKLDQKDIQKLNEQNINAQSMNAQKDDFVVLEENDFEKKQISEQKEEVIVATPYAQEIDLLGKDMYENPYLFKKKMNNDTVKLGSKTWKPNEAEKEKNKKIDAAKAISKKATGYTLDIHNAVADVNKTHSLEKAKKTDDERIFIYIGRLSSVHFTAKMFTSAYIAKHFKECYSIVDTYRRMNELDGSDLGDDDIEIFQKKELFTLFEKRVFEFAKKNHVDINTGKGIDSSLTEEEKITDDDYNKWLVLIGDEKQRRREYRQNEDLKNIHRINLSEEEIKAAKEEAIKTDYNEIEENIFDFVKMSSVDRIKAIHALKGYLEAITKELNPSDALSVSYELRKERCEVKAFLRLATAELKMLELKNSGHEDLDDLKKNYPGELKEFFEASEDVRKLTKRINSNGIEVVANKTVPKGIIKLSKEEAISTESDILSMNKRLSILRLANKATDNIKDEKDKEGKTAKEFNKLVKSYFNKNFYKVGSRSEAEAMTKVLNFIKKNKLRQVLRYQDVIKEIDSMTQGNLDINEDNIPKEDFIDRTQTMTRPISMDSSDMRSKFFAKANSLLDTFTKWVDRSDEPLFAHEPTVNDLRQGKVSNCWMVSATTAVININPQIIKDAMKDNGDGTVTVRLYTSAKDKNTGLSKTVPKYVRMKKEVPKLITGGAVHTSGALWMQMLEKAAAFLGYKSPSDQKQMRGYNALWHGTQGSWLFALTGVQDTRILTIPPMTRELIYADDFRTKGVEGFTKPPKGEEDCRNERFKTELFNDLLTARQRGIIYTFGSKMKGNEGMNDGHAYTVLGAKEIDGERYVIMRNPYGNMVAEYDEKGKLHRTDTYMSSSMNETYGQFIIKLDDFLKNAGIVTRLDTKKMGNIKKEDEKKNEEEKKSVVPKAQIDNDVDDF